MSVSAPSAAALAAFEQAKQQQRKKKRLSSGKALTDVTALVLNDDESEKALLRAEKARAQEAAEQMQQQTVGAVNAAAAAAASASSSGASKRKSLAPAGLGKLSLAPSVAAAAAVRRVVKPMDPAEWKETMKMASSGKFNSKNIGLVWSNDLISQMRDLLLGPAARAAQSSASSSSAKMLFDSDMDALGGGEQSNQFQKASCTLDASMMIYSSRVDDVHKSTFKVLGGLSNGTVASAVGDDTDSSDSEEGSAALGEDGAPLPKKKKVRRVGGVGGAATLEPNPSKLDARLLETEVESDPLFHLTTAKFEGGAGGMLMNNLSVYTGARIALDSSEEYILDNRPLPQGSRALEQLAKEVAREEAALRLNMDFSALASTLVRGIAAAGADSFAELRLTPTVDALLAERAALRGQKLELPPPPAAALAGRKGKAAAAAAAAAEAAAAAAAAAAAIPVEFDFAAVCLPPEPDLPLPSEGCDAGCGDASFVSDSGAAAAASASASAHDKPLEVLSMQMAAVVAAMAQERALEAQMAEFSGGGGGGFDHDQDDDDDYGGHDDDGARSHATAHSAASGSGSTVAAGAAAEDDNTDGMGLLDGLGDQLKSNWAGLKHWKFRAKPSAAVAFTAGAKAVAAAAAGKKKRAARAAKDVLDFSAVPLSPAAWPVLAPSGSATLRQPEQLASGWERRAREASLKLPDDRFYKVRNLQTLCQKPAVLVKLRSSASARRAVLPVPGSGSAGAEPQTPQRSGEALPAHAHAHAHASVEFVEATPAHSALDGAGAAGMGAGALGHGVGNSPFPGHGGEAADAPALSVLQFDDGDDDHENEAILPSGGDFDDDEEMGDADADADSAPMGLAMLAAPCRAERIEIGYARVSKKVDVKALKATMWSGLERPPPPPPAAAAGASSSAEQGKAKPCHTFSSAIQAVRALAAGELATQLPAITPSYYFISLLHLCNEHGLALEDSPAREGVFGDFNIVQQ